MTRPKNASKRTQLQATSDRAAEDLAQHLGKTLAMQRRARRLTQAQASALAGISQSMWSHLEVGRDGRVTLATWYRATTAVGGRLKAYIDGASAADQPRDAVHLRNQELVMRTAVIGGWRALPEVPLGADARTARAADIVLARGHDYALCEVFDWFDDVGAAARDWPRRLESVERYAIARMRDDTLPRVSGAWVVRATRRNRELLREHGHYFRALLPGSSVGWLRALSEPTAPMAPQAGIIWASVAGDRLLPLRW